MTRYTVKQLAEKACTSVRALHHYDDIGLLKPAWIGDNGYRYYEQPQLVRLQHILLYRDFGMTLDEIGVVLDGPEDKVAERLRGHRQRLVERLKSQQALLDVIEATLRRIDGDTPMTETYPQIWQSEEKAAEYKTWLMERYSATIDAALGKTRRRLTAMTPEERLAIRDMRTALEAELVEAFRAGTTVEALAESDILTRYRDWLATIWADPATPAKYAGLADVYVGFKDYADYFDGLAPGLTAWLAAGIKRWAALETA